METVCEMVWERVCKAGQQGHSEARWANPLFSGFNGSQKHQCSIQTKKLGECEKTRRREMEKEKRWQKLDIEIGNIWKRKSKTVYGGEESFKAFVMG